MKKKFLALALATSMVAGVMTGCGNKEVANDSGDVEVTEAEAEPEAAEPEDRPPPLPGIRPDTDHLLRIPEASLFSPPG